MNDLRTAKQQKPDQVALLDAQLCRVGGLNQNYLSSSGAAYHIQVEDRGPLVDRLSDQPVRRINVVIYSNYGEPTARIFYSYDHDLPDVRTQEHNRVVQQRIQDLTSGARKLIEEREQRQVTRIKCLIREYHYAKTETAKRELDNINVLFPSLFSRAWHELRGERQRSTEAAPAADTVVVEALGAEPVGGEALGAAPASAAPVDDVEAEVAAPEDVAYPLEQEMREVVIEIERIIVELGRDVQMLRQRGAADDILLQTWRKLVTRAKDSISMRQQSEFTTRRLEMTRNGLMTTWRQVRSRLRALGLVE